MPDRDMYAEGHSAGYSQALIDVAAETDRVTGPVSLRGLLEQLRYQYLTQEQGL